MERLSPIYFDKQNHTDQNKDQYKRHKAFRMRGSNITTYKQNQIHVINRKAFMKY